MKVLLICILIFIFKDFLKVIVKEAYNIWDSNPYIRYGRNNVSKLKDKIKRTINNKINNRNSKLPLIKKYSVVYMPNNNQVIYNNISGSYIK